MKHYDLETSILGHLLVWSQGCAKVFFNLDRSFSHLKEKFPLQVMNVETIFYALQWRTHTQSRCFMVHGALCSVCTSHMQVDPVDGILYIRLFSI